MRQLNTVDADIVAFPSSRQEAERAAVAHFSNAYARLEERYGRDEAQVLMAQGFIAWAVARMMADHDWPVKSAFELSSQIIGATQEALKASRQGFDPSDGDERNGLGGAA